MLDLLFRYQRTAGWVLFIAGCIAIVTAYQLVQPQ